MLDEIQSITSLSFYDIRVDATLILLRIVRIMVMRLSGE